MGKKATSIFPSRARGYRVRRRKLADVCVGNEVPEFSARSCARAVTSAGSPSVLQVATTSCGSSAAFAVVGTHSILPVERETRLSLKVASGVNSRFQSSDMNRKDIQVQSRQTSALDFDLSGSTNEGFIRL